MPRDYGEPPEDWEPPNWFIHGRRVITGFSYTVENFERDKQWYKIWKARRRKSKINTFLRRLGLKK